jgi:hypothetical protein
MKSWKDFEGYAVGVLVGNAGFGVLVGCDVGWDVGKDDGEKTGCADG